MSISPKVREQRIPFTTWEVVGRSLLQAPVLHSRTAGCSTIPPPTLQSTKHTVDHLPHHTPPPFNTLRFPRAGSKGQMTLQHPQPSLQQSRSWAQTVASGCTNMGNTSLFNRCFWGFVISEARRALEFTSISWFFIFSPSSSPGLA